MLINVLSSCVNGFGTNNFCKPSNFGTLDSCRYNLENLLSAGVTNQVFAKGRNELTSDEKAILDQLAALGYEKYLNFKNHKTKNNGY